MKSETKREAARRRTDAEFDQPPVVDGELIVDSPDEIDLSGGKQTKISPRNKQIAGIENRKPESEIRDQKTYLLLPFLFLTATLFGGLRFAEADGAFLFLKPALACLIFAAVLITLFFRAGLLRIEGWFSEEFTTLKNIANGAVLLTLFTASVQVFNALLPERGLPFWVIAFCFFWTLWNNIFAEFEVKRLIKSLGALFGLAFVVKYILLASLTAPAAESWWQGIWQNPAKEAFTWALELPRFSAATGYIQFFTLGFYLLGLFLISPTTRK